MRLVICPGIHDPKLTDCFLEGLSEVWGDAEPQQNTQTHYPIKIFPAHKHPAFSALDIFHFLWEHQIQSPRTLQDLSKKYPNESILVEKRAKTPEIGRASCRERVLMPV